MNPITLALLQGHPVMLYRVNKPEALQQIFDEWERGVLETLEFWPTNIKET